MKALFTIALCTGLAGAASAASHHFVIEHAGVGGTQEEAQPYIDKLMRWLEKAAGWAPSSASGEFAPDPKTAIEAMRKHKPSFGLMDPELWLALRKEESLQPIAQVEGKRQSIGKMYLVVKKESAVQKLDELKGKKLASNHFQSHKYLSKVIFDGKLDVASYFQLAPQTTLIRALKAVDGGTVDAALLDQADLDYLKTSAWSSMRTVFESGKVPPTPVVAFKKVASEKESEAVAKALGDICRDEKNGGAQVCKDLEIEKFAPADKSAFDEAVRRYEK